MKRLAFFITAWTCAATMMLGLAGIPAARAQLEVLDENQAPGRTMAQQATKERQIWITADHSKHQALQKTFTNGPEITQACLSCHSEVEESMKDSVLNALSGGDQCCSVCHNPHTAAGEALQDAGVSILFGHFQQQIVQPVYKSDGVIQLAALGEHGLVEHQL